jgi:hypothetical protein
MKNLIYLVFVYIWRPEAPKVKSLGELLGYTIVKKTELKAALAMASREHFKEDQKLKLILLIHLK